MFLYLSACTSFRVKGRIGNKQNVSSFGNFEEQDSRKSSAAQAGQSHGSSLSDEFPHARHSIPKTKFATVLKTPIKPPVIKRAQNHAPRAKALYLYNTLFSGKLYGKILSTRFEVRL
jgi:hypothetical protein